MQREPAPYHFVSVQPEAAIQDSPVLHDQLDLSGSWSGELLCTLTALTPLLAANDQYELAKAEEKLRQEFDKLARGRFPNNKPPGAAAEKKKVLEPLALPGPDADTPGEILIAGAALKGMLRQSLSALLSAPMERVAERSASYRPNVKTLTGKHNPIRVAWPALVVGGGGRDNPDNPATVQILVLDGLVGTICYVQPEVVHQLPQRIRDLLAERPDVLQSRYADPRQRQALCLTASECSSIRGVGLSMAGILKSRGPNPVSRLEGWLPVVNLNGIDLDAGLNQLFHEANPELARELSTKSPGGYPLLFLRLPNRKPPETLEGPVLRAFYRSLQHLCDADQGHLRGHPLLEAGEQMEAIIQRIRAFWQRGLRPGDIVFLEKTTNEKGESTTSLGHHFYYRWRARTTVHRTVRPEDQARHAQQAAPALRDILCPRKLEMTPERPQELSGARLLFGYVGTPQGQYKDTEPLTFGIGQRQGEQTDFAQLAGRLSFNTAVEREAKRPLSERFLNDGSACLVPLRPLGAPKVSAVEHYLTQDRLAERDDGGILCTYGDTPQDVAVGNLRGRKFYLHQPEAAQKRERYELTAEGNPDWKSGSTFHLLGDQAGIGRFVSRPGTRFRFALRFVNLRLWELGALLFTVQPTPEAVRRLLTRLPAQAHPELERWMELVKKKSWDATPKEAPLLAHKLGHGRPLGLGSVKVEVDCLKRLVPDTLQQVALQATEKAALIEQHGQALDAFADFLSRRLGDRIGVWVKRCLVPWLQVHRYAGRRSYDYPRRDKKGERTVFNYHSEIRSRHAEGRKRRKPAGARSPLGLTDLDELDGKDAASSGGL